MRLHFKLAAMLPALAGMLLLASCAKGPSSVSVVPSSLELDEGGSGSLTAEVLPDNAKYGKISWTSSDESVATVSGGSVHALKAGTATITAMTEGVSGTARVTVKSKSIPVSGVNLSDSSIELVEGDSKQLSATVSPDNATDKSVSWKSADPSIATVDNNGKVTAVATGETTITVTTTDGGRTASCTITVKPVEATALSIDPSTAEIVKGGSLELQVTFVPENTTDKELTWSSTNPSVASVSEDGVVNALNEGKTKIYATASNGVKNYCEVTVLRDESLKGISFGVSSMELKVGETRRIDVYFTPDYAANTHLSWESSANGVVTVKDGDVTGVSEGEAVITATSEEGGFTASCKVIVSNKNETGIYFIAGHGYLYKNGTVYSTDYHNCVCSDEDGNLYIVVGPHAYKNGEYIYQYPYDPSNDMQKCYASRYGMSYRAGGNYSSHKYIIDRATDEGKLESFSIHLPDLSSYDYNSNIKQLAISADGTLYGIGQHKDEFGVVNAHLYSLTAGGETCMIQFGEGPENSYGSSVAVTQSGDVYSMVLFQGGSGMHKCIVYKNGKQFKTLCENFWFGGAAVRDGALFVEGNDIYAAYKDDETVVVMKNWKEYLSFGFSSSKKYATISDMYVSSGGDIYVMINEVDGDNHCRIVKNGEVLYDIPSEYDGSYLTVIE